MIDIEKEMKNSLNVSEEEFCKYLDQGSTKSLAWWNDVFNQSSLNKESPDDKTTPEDSPE